MGTTSRTRWIRSVAPFGAPPDAVDEVHADLVERYGEPQRRYHTLAHVQHVVRVGDELGSDARLSDVDALLVYLAAWWHDAVYDPARSDNEEASAVLAEQQAARLGLPPAVVDGLVRLIRLTAGHEVAPDDAVGQVLVDADLAILGAPADAYDAYAASVRLEHGHLDDATFRAGRAAFLRGFLARPHLFAGATGRDRFEARARGNLGRELAALDTPDNLDASAGEPPGQAPGPHAKPGRERAS